MLHTHAKPTQYKQIGKVKRPTSLSIHSTNCDRNITTCRFFSLPLLPSLNGLRQGNRIPIEFGEITDFRRIIARTKEPAKLPEIHLYTHRHSLGHWSNSDHYSSLYRRPHSSDRTPMSLFSTTVCKYRIIQYNIEYESRLSMAKHPSFHSQTLKLGRKNVCSVLWATAGWSRTVVDPLQACQCLISEEEEYP